MASASAYPATSQLFPLHRSGPQTPDTGCLHGCMLAPPPPHTPFLAFFCHSRAELSRHLGAFFVTMKVLPLAPHKAVGSVSSGLHPLQDWSELQEAPGMDPSKLGELLIAFPGQESLTEAPFSSLPGKDLERFFFCEGTDSSVGAYCSRNEQNKAGGWFLGSKTSNLECVLADQPVS